MPDIKYIDDDEVKGIKYDWKLIKREYRKLKIPKKYYNPCTADPEKCGYVIALSDRTHGKTTETLLLGMLMNKLYGTIVHYIRNAKDSITPYALRDLFPVIQENGYIEQLTDGQYNGVWYYGHKWFYCHYDENGKRVETAPEHFMICMHLGESGNRKSSYNCPRGDIIIFDEFIDVSGYAYNDFTNFSDLVSTIFRKRLCPIIYMLSNTIDINSPWFDELCLRDSIETIEHGENRYIESPLGTVSFVQLLEPDKSEQAQSFIKRFFGFNNPKLAAITGRGKWATEQYPHIPKRKENETEPEILYSKLYVKQSGKLLRLQLMSTDIGLCVYVVPATQTYDDSIILTHGEIHARNEMFCFGPKNSRIQIFWRLYQGNRFYYKNNYDGALFAAYVKACKEEMKGR